MSELNSEESLTKEISEKTAQLENLRKSMNENSPTVQEKRVELIRLRRSLEKLQKVRFEAEAKQLVKDKEILVLEDRAQGLCDRCNQLKEEYVTLSSPSSYPKTNDHIQALARKAELESQITKNEAALHKSDPDYEVKKFRLDVLKKKNLRGVQEIIDNAEIYIRSNQLEKEREMSKLLERFNRVCNNCDEAKRKLEEYRRSVGEVANSPERNARIAAMRHEEAQMNRNLQKKLEEEGRIARERRGSYDPTAANERLKQMAANAQAHAENIIARYGSASPAAPVAPAANKPPRGFFARLFAKKGGGRRTRRHRTRKSKKTRRN